MLAVGAALVDRGHTVTVLTGSRFEERVREAGAEFRTLSGIADFDDRDLDSYLPERERYRGLARAQYDIQRIFVKPIVMQHQAVVELLSQHRFDAVLTDGAFAGVLPLLMAGTADRPPIVALGVTPLTQLSADVAPSGMGIAPSATRMGRLRNRAFNTLARTVLFRDTQRIAQRSLAELGAAPFAGFVMDLSREFDRYLQLGAAQFEYPRSDISSNVSFVGVLPSRPSSQPAPSWWADLDGSRPVVHVTQGTIDNHDIDRLIRPTIAALADKDVTVVVSMGGRDPQLLGEIPPNVRVASYLDYELLLPLTDVFVTNGGFGGVQHALSHGVPIVVAGDTEDKPEVAARVAWSGVGVNLRTGRPSVTSLRAAVDALLGDPRYAQNTRSMQEAIATYATIDLIEAELGTLSQ